MKRWLWSRRYAIATFAGLGGIWVMDVANAIPEMSTGFWTLPSDQGFHLGIWTAIAAFVFVALSDAE